MQSCAILGLGLEAMQVPVTLTWWLPIVCLRPIYNFLSKNYLAFGFNIVTAVLVPMTAFR